MGREILMYPPPLQNLWKCATKDIATLFENNFNYFPLIRIFLYKQRKHKTTATIRQLFIRYLCLYKNWRLFKTSTRTSSCQRLVIKNVIWKLTGRRILMFKGEISPFHESVRQRTLQHHLRTTLIIFDIIRILLYK